jgi:hypothetical protein
MLHLAEVRPGGGPALEVTEVPSVTHPRSERNLRPVRDGMRVLRRIARERMAHDRTSGGAPPRAAVADGPEEVSTALSDSQAALATAHREEVE